MDQPYSGFWGTLPKPIIALSPMDGVTDFACRYIMARHGRPDVVFTEFTTAEGLFYAPERILKDFEYCELERPVVAQIFGHRPEDFYRATMVVCELGFDGVDINMGCPAKQVVQKNCGAKLITTPDLALEILQATRAAIEDWVRGRGLEDLPVSERLIETVFGMNSKRIGQGRLPLRRPIPYSVKTRVGYDSVVIERWVETLLRESPAAVSIHGRTLKQMYKGSASWDAIAAAVRVAKGTGTLILGNGDISSLEEAWNRIRQTGVDGVLIGRTAIGNPWIFRKELLEVHRGDRIEVALEHAAYLTDKRGERNFKSIRKHLIGYLSHFPEAAAYRNRALQAVNLPELVGILHPAGVE